MLFLHLKCLLSGLSEDSLSNSRIPVRLGISGVYTWFNPLPSTCFRSIQAAVDAAAATITIGKDKIDFYPGTYVENVVIGAGNEVDIKGDGPGLIIVHPLAGTAGPAFLADGAGKVKIKDLTVDGLSGMPGAVVTGIQFLNTEGAVKNTEVLNIRNPTGAAQGIGIRVDTDNGGNHKVKIKDNLISNYTRVGILGDGVGADLDIKNNAVMGPALPRVSAPNGIQVSRGAKGKVEKNEVDNNPSPNPPGGVGSGIILFCSGPGVKVKDNEVTEADLGVTVIDASLAKVEKNDISGSGFAGIYIFDGSTNTIKLNDIATSGVVDARDDTVGGGTAGTDNTWDQNNCATSSPAGLCN